MSWVHVAVAVASMIASHNRGDGGMGAILKASLQYQRLMLDALENITKSLAHVIQQIGKLDQAIAGYLDASRAAEVRESIAGTVGAYQMEVRRAAGSTYQEWLDQTVTQENIATISTELSLKVGRVLALRQFDPPTAAMLPMIAELDLALNNLRSGSTFQNLLAIAQTYIDIIDDAQGDNEGSIGALLAEHLARLAVFKEALLGFNFHIPDDAGKEGDATRHAVFLQRVDVQDYEPERMEEVGFRTGSGKSDSGWVRIPERYGELETFELVVVVEKQLVPIPGSDGYMIRQFSIDPTKAVELEDEAGNSGLSEWGSNFRSRTPSELIRVNAPTSQARRAALVNGGFVKRAEVKKESLGLLLLQLNDCISLITIDLSVLAALAGAIDELRNFRSEHSVLYLASLELATDRPPTIQPPSIPPVDSNFSQRLASGRSRVRMLAQLGFAFNAFSVDQQAQELFDAAATKGVNEAVRLGQRGALIKFEIVSMKAEGGEFLKLRDEAVYFVGSGPEANDVCAINRCDVPLVPSLERGMSLEKSSGYYWLVPLEDGSLDVRRYDMKIMQSRTRQVATNSKLFEKVVRTAKSQALMDYGVALSRRVASLEDKSQVQQLISTLRDIRERQRQLEVEMEKELRRAERMARTGKALAGYAAVFNLAAAIAMVVATSGETPTNRSGQPVTSHQELEDWVRRMEAEGKLRLKEAEVGWGTELNRETGVKQEFFELGRKYEMDPGTSKTLP